MSRTPDGKLSLAMQLVRIFWFALRIAVVIWAVFILFVGTSTAIDPGAADSEPQPHSLSERFWGIAYVALSLSWILSPRFARRGFRKPMVVMLLVLLLVFTSAWAVRSILGLVTYELPGSAWRHFLLVGLFVALPAVLTIGEIIANPHPIRILPLMCRWKESRLDIVNLR